MTFDPEQIAPPGAKIKVIGVGGGGGNAVNTMIKSGLEGVDFITCNTDIQSLKFSLAPYKVQIGKELTRGLGAGADPDVGRDAALEDRHEIQEFLTGADMVFITAGMGGGTGTGGASVVAQIARELGALTVAVVTKPFTFEGKRRKKHSEIGIARLREAVDTLITIPNQRLLQVATPGLSMMEAFKMADDVLVNAVRGISDIINIPGTVNVDFADVKTVMSCMGQALMGIGRGIGESRAIDAARQAISSPLLEDIDIEGATGILINITAGSDVTLMEVNEACSIIQEAAHEDANIIFGAVIDETLGEEIRVTVIATGFPVESQDSDAIEILKQHQQSTLQGYSSTRLTSSPNPKPLTRPTLGAQSGNSLTNRRLDVQTHRSTNPMVVSKASEVKPEGELSAAVPTSGPATAMSPKTPIPTFSETEELARWTLEESASRLAASAPLPPVPQVPEPRHHETPSARAPAAQPFAAQPSNEGMTGFERFEGARLLDDPKDDFVKDASFSGGERFVDRIFSDDFLDSPAESTSPVSASDEELTAAAPVNLGLDEDVPLDAFFRNNFSADDIDRKIDEALELAERLKAPLPSKPLGGQAPTSAKDADDLDVPAFLRGGAKEIPLG